MPLHTYKQLRVVNYIRVSTKGQALEEKYSLRAQDEELTANANRENWKIVDKVIDVDSGGKFDKKGLQRITELADAKAMDVVQILDQSRLSRLDGIYWEMLKAVLKENDVKLAEPGSMIDLNDEIQEFFSDIKNFFARRGRKEIPKTMMRGKRQMMREGKTWGKVPFEYIKDKNTKIISVNEKYAWTIPTIDDLYLKEQLGLVTIAKKLNEIAWTPNGPWNETLVHRRLISEAFHGDMIKHFANGETIRIESAYPELRTKETYNEIQEERKRRKTQYKVQPLGEKKYIHFLRRTELKCGECGYKIGLQMHGTKDNPYFYLKHGRKKRISDQTVCSISINTSRVDHNIINAVKEILTSENLAKKYIDLDTDDSDVKSLKQQLKQNRQFIGKLNTKKERLIDLYMDGDFDKVKLDKRKQEIENELAQYKKQELQMSSKLEALEKRQWNYDLIYQYMELAENFDTELSPLERAQMIGKLFPAAVVYSSKLVLHGEMNGGIPLEVEVPIDPDPYSWHHTKRPDFKI